jgi:hypothetical protein
MALDDFERALLDPVTLDRESDTFLFGEAGTPITGLTPGQIGRLLDWRSLESEIERHAPASRLLAKTIDITDL